MSRTPLQRAARTGCESLQGPRPKSELLKARRAVRVGRNVLDVQMQVQVHHAAVQDEAMDRLVIRAPLATSAGNQLDERREVQACHRISAE